MNRTRYNWIYSLIIGILSLFQGIQTTQGLIISEIMYNPAVEQMEFIELYNQRAVKEDLSGFSFTKGIDYTFEPGTMLEAHSYLVIALDPMSVQKFYNITGVLGPYTGKLNNSGERVELSNASGATVLSIRYRDDLPWPIAPDGTGHSLVLTSVSADPDRGDSWRASTFMGGTPGSTSTTSLPLDSDLCINELLANPSSTNGKDWLELYNAGSSTLSLDHVYLSDEPDNLLKYKLPQGILLEPGDFWSVDLQTNTFALKASGEAVFVTLGSMDAVPTPLRVLDAVRYEAVPPDTTWGRYPDGSSTLGLLYKTTQGRANAHPLIHHVVINEVMYHHALRDDRYEYIELYNRSEESVSLEDWTFTDGIDYTFPTGTSLAPHDYMVVAKDPNLLISLYENLILGRNLVGPFKGTLDDHSERIRLAYPLYSWDPNTGHTDIRLITADEVTYYDGGRWPEWADGMGASLELKDPDSDNRFSGAWTASDESSKSSWVPFSFTIDAGDKNYTHDRVSVFDMMLLNQGEVLLDNIQLTIEGQPRLDNSGFESGTSSWRMLGNHVQSFVTSLNPYSGSKCLHLIATGHGDPGANRINQSISDVTGGTVTFSGQAKWLKGSRFFLVRTTRERKPVQPPRPAKAFELAMPLNLGTPGKQNTAFATNRGPDIVDVKHTPVLPKRGESIVVSARITDKDGIQSVELAYRTEGQDQFFHTSMLDNGQGYDPIAQDNIYTGVIPPISTTGTRAFRIHASDGMMVQTFPEPLSPSAEVPDRTCLVRVDDTVVSSPFARYHVWLSNEVINTFKSRTNLSNELMDCTFVYNETDVFYNAKIRFRGSPFLRGGSGWSPLNGHGYRIEFNSDQRFGCRTEINLDNTEQHKGTSRGPLQERASFWFYKQMGLPYSRQEFVRLVINGNNRGKYEDVQKIDGDYIDAWFPNDNDGYIHKVDDYFELNTTGTSKSNLDEGLKYDASHPLIPETYRWGFEKRSHKENDTWDHLFDFAVAMNTPSSDPAYEAAIESVIDPDYFARILAIRHAVGDWDSYGYNRGKNNLFYYATQEKKWYLLPWDIDFTLGSGRASNDNLFSVTGNKFPEVQQFLNYPKYKEMYLNAFSELVSGPWKTSYQSGSDATAFDQFLDDAASALEADGEGTGRRDGIKQFVRDRRAYILTQIPSLVFEITTHNGEPFCTSESTVVIQGYAPTSVASISVNGSPVPTTFSGSNHAFETTVPINIGNSLLTLQGLNTQGSPVSGATDSILVTRVQVGTIIAVTPNSALNSGTVQLTIHGTDFLEGSTPSVAVTSPLEDIGFDALYVKSHQAFSQIDAATLLLDDPSRGVGNEIRAVHPWINLSNQGDQGVFSTDQTFAPPYDSDNTNYAIRFSGYAFVDSPGTRYFGVNSDDGFSLHIDGQLVGEYANARGPSTTDVKGNRTDGTMTFDFPAAGAYYLELDFYENGGGEAIEFFQTNASGNDRKLINIDSELTVYRDAMVHIHATNVTVINANTITCQIDLSGAEPGLWNVVVTPDCGEARLDNALTVVSQ